MATYATKASDIKRNWYVVDAEGEILGRLASEIAALLMGKWKPLTCDYLDVGDHVIVTNAEKIRVTGKKAEKKTYFRHSGYIGSGRTTSFHTRMKKESAQVVRDAIWGMIPHNRLGRQVIRKLKVYAGPEHPHTAQQPIPLKVGLHGRGYPGQLSETGQESPES